MQSNTDTNIYLQAKHLITAHQMGEKVKISYRKYTATINGQVFPISPASIDKYNYYLKTGFIITNN